MVLGKSLKTNLKVARSFGDYQFKSNLVKPAIKEINAQIFSW
jgi:hypothetical protein